jgi:hypothetical protein
VLSRRAKQRGCSSSMAAIGFQKLVLCCENVSRVLSMLDEGSSGADARTARGIVRSSLGIHLHRLRQKGRAETNDA